jgi:hypothetical protein
VKFLLALFGGCLHARTTFPQTPVRTGSFRGRPYVCCLDCGRRFDYDWESMRVGAEIPPRPTRPADGPQGAADQVAP